MDLVNESVDLIITKMARSRDIRMPLLCEVMMFFLALFSEKKGGRKSRDGHLGHIYSQYFISLGTHNNDEINK